MDESESLIDPSRFEMLVQLSENNSGFFDELMRTFYNDATTNIDEMRNSLYVVLCASPRAPTRAPTFFLHAARLTKYTIRYPRPCFRSCPTALAF